LAGVRPFVVLLRYMCGARRRNGLRRKLHTKSSPCPSVLSNYKFHNTQRELQSGAVAVNDLQFLVFSISKPTSLGPTRTMSPKFSSAQAVNGHTRIQTELFVEFEQDIRHRLLLHHFDVCLPPSRGFGSQGTGVGSQWVKKHIVGEKKDP
jgi:hypothetical protein